MGTLIISRYERHPIGWLLSVVGAAGAVSLVSEAYAFWVQENDGPGRPRSAASRRGSRRCSEARSSSPGSP